MAHQEPAIEGALPRLVERRTRDEVCQVVLSDGLPAVEAARARRGVRSPDAIRNIRRLSVEPAMLVDLADSPNPATWVLALGTYAAGTLRPTHNPIGRGLW